eukprot:TRINITY_DN7336_c0_g1_i10.p4 TRINITY_DN7336_c0_g1~~TRINITY_DN7336_c0_g1_i10.p4  ORF type:complete len:160 (+),score=59.46 TRINITY_DN7336_c0_g1_i10:247-726(+)
MARKSCVTVGFLYDENKVLDENVDRCNKQIAEYEEFGKDSKSRLHAMQMELDTKTGIIQEQMEEFERLEKEMRQKTAELNEKDELINDHARVVKEYVTEIMSVKDSLENEKEATANLKQENEYFNKRIQEHKKEIEQLERKMDETVSQKNAMEKSLFQH